MGGDLDSTAIYFCVAEATMRPLVLGKHPPQTMRLVEPPESLRGSISRLQIADPKVRIPSMTLVTTAFSLTDKRR